MKIYSRAIVGGTSIRYDKIAVPSIQIAIGTPGRMNDLVQRKLLKVDNLKLLIIDECD